MLFCPIQLETWPRTPRPRGLTHREPLADEKDLERYLATIVSLMRPGRDTLWILAGRTESNLPKIKTLLRKYRLYHDAFYLCYNTKQMAQYGHWRRQGGIANSKSIEQAIFAYLGFGSKNLPKSANTSMLAVLSLIR